MIEKHYIKDYIVFMDGTARVAGKEHLKAEIVARMVVDGEREIEYVMEHYKMTRSQVYAVLAYYYENQDELDKADAEFWQNDDLMTRNNLLKEIDDRQTKPKDD
jgi:uncharacterized protein (DUF433 family)